MFSIYEKLKNIFTVTVLSFTNSIFNTRTHTHSLISLLFWFLEIMHNIGPYCDSCLGKIKNSPSMDCPAPEIKFTVSITGLFWIFLFLHYRFDFFCLNRIFLKIAEYQRKKKKRRGEKKEKKKEEEKKLFKRSARASRPSAKRERRASVWEKWYPVKKHLRQLCHPWYHYHTFAEPCPKGAWPSI